MFSSWLSQARLQLSRLHCRSSSLGDNSTVVTVETVETVVTVVTVVTVETVVTVVTVVTVETSSSVILVTSASLTVVTSAYRGSSDISDISLRDSSVAILGHAVLCHAVSRPCHASGEHTAFL